MANLYANENFPLPVVIELRKLGHNVLTTVEAGKANQAIPDEDVLEFARSQNRAVLTINRKHFVRLHESQKPHAGIIACSLDLDFSAQAARIHELLGAASNISGKLIRVNRPA
jgi:Domain of unknown function (DUF5615)